MSFYRKNTQVQSAAPTITRRRKSAPGEVPMQESGGPILEAIKMAAKADKPNNRADERLRKKLKPKADAAEDAPVGKTRRGARQAGGRGTDRDVDRGVDRDGGVPEDRLKKAFGFRTSLDPSGRMKRGSKHRATQMAEELLAGQGKLLIRVMIERALLGCPTCLKLCAERLMPVKRESTIQIKVPPIRKLTDIPAAMEAVAAQVFSGDITLGEGRNAAALLTAWADSMALAADGGGTKDPSELAKKLRDAARAMDSLSSAD